MAHQGGTMNLVIHDPSGNPQVIKVQKGPASKTLAKPESIKILTSKPGQVTQLVNANPGSIIPGTALRTLTIQSQQRYVTVPVTPQLQSLIRKQNASQSASASAQQTKTIQLPTQSILVSAEEESSPSSRKRKESENGAEYPSDYTGNKRRKSDKGGKGLRHFSMKVCEKVRKKGTTTYNEVADELVAEFTNPTLIPNSVDQQYDQKNIRRRVYDALNVLMAMNIIAKEKKEIRWLGLPTTSAQECSSLIKEKEQITERIQAKTQQLYELMLQQISYKNLVQRNFEMEKNRGQPQPNSVIHLPFIVVNSDRKTVIDCSITNDKTEYHFVFNDKFQIHDDFEILKQIGLTDGLENGTVTEQNLAKIKSMLPKPMEKYISQLALEGVQNNMKKEDNLDLDEFAQDDCAGTSTEIFHTEDVDSPEETSDEESNISADLEHV